MSRNRVYPPEFRQKLLELVASGRSPEELAKEFEPSAGIYTRVPIGANGSLKRTVLGPAPL
jgi:hypothetical protein